MIGIGSKSYLFTNTQVSMHTFTRVNSPTAVGIDVAKASLSVCIRTKNGNEHALTIRNTDADINAKLLPRLSGYTGIVVMESTGHYHWTPALLLRDSGMDVRVVNPLLSKQYTAGNIRKVKTDPADAAGLARMAVVCDRLPSSFSLSRNKLEIRKKLSTIGHMSHQVQALTASLKSLRDAQELLGTDDTPAVRSLDTAVKTLKRSINALERECVKETRSDKHVATSMDLLTSIPGVSPVCATLALNWFTTGDGITDKSWIAFAGLDISSRESGTWKGQCRLTKRGNSVLRKRLYSAAWGAWMHDEEFKKYYNILREQGRAHTEALVILARKIVRTMFIVFKDQTPFNPAKFHCKVRSI